MPGKNIPLQNVHIQDHLWDYYMNLIVDSTLPYQYEALHDRIPGATPSGAFHNFQVAAGEVEGEHIGRCFQDSDLGKWIEACAYSLCWKPDPELEARVDAAIDLIGRAQRADGYLNTYFLLARPGLEFTNLYECHELYTFGHLAEAAVAWYEATGKRNLLDIICRYADLIVRTFGPGEHQLHGYDGHQEVELALVKLYKATGNKSYLDLAQYELSERGKEPSFFDMEWEKNDPKYYFYPIPPERRPSENKTYNQCHMAPADQSDAVGHAVRMTYMCIGMSDVARESGDVRLMDACKRLWHSIVDRNMYITGVVGSTHHGEAFSFDYNLPNDRVYGESCASVGMILFAHSMLLNESNSRYADVMETVLYNAVLAAISLDGKRFFYVNPLEVLPEACAKDQDMAHVKPVRQKWFGTACCPPNLARMLASLGRYIYHQDQDTVYVDLYIANKTDFNLSGGNMTLTLEGEYPWNGRLDLTVGADKPVNAEIALRIPAWCKQWQLCLNGKPVAQPEIRMGYAILRGIFANGDKISLHLEMKPRFLCAHPAVRQDSGKVALEWGPMVYCLEEEDNGSGLAALSVNPDVSPAVGRSDAFPLDHLTLTAAGSRQIPPADNALYYDLDQQSSVPAALHFIPYFLWGNRSGENAREMTVWVHKQEQQ